MFARICDRKLWSLAVDNKVLLPDLFYLYGQPSFITHTIHTAAIFNRRDQSVNRTRKVSSWTRINCYLRRKKCFFTCCVFNQGSGAAPLNAGQKSNKNLKMLLKFNYFFKLHAWRHPGRANMHNMQTKKIHMYTTQTLVPLAAYSSRTVYICQKDDFDPTTACKAPICWSKYAKCMVQM